MIPAIAGALAASPILIGAWAVARSARNGLVTIDLFVSYSAGFMIALAIAEAIPEALARTPGTAGIAVLAGYLLVHFAQHTLTPHFHFGEETHQVSANARRAALAGLGLHTFFDGVAIASGFLVTPALGMLFFLAIALHKIPEGVAVASLVLASGGSVRDSYVAAGLMGLATLAGAVVTGMSSLLSAWGLALSAGVTLYVGASNLVPEFQQRRGLRVPLSFVGGVVTFLVAREVLARVSG